MRLLPIIGIMGAAWLLIIAETYVFFGVVLEFAPPISELGRLTALALLKVFLTLSLGAIWFLVILFLTELYISSKLRSRTPTSSS